MLLVSLFIYHAIDKALQRDLQKGAYAWTGLPGHPRAGAEKRRRGAAQGHGGAPSSVGQGWVVVQELTSTDQNSDMYIDRVNNWAS